MIRDTIYNDLKEQGLLLSNGASLQLPPIRPPRASVIRQVSSIFAPQFSVGQGPFKVIILPVLNSAVLVARANTLICYKFEIDKQTSAPIFAEPKIQNLPFVIKSLHICDNRFLNDRGEVPFIVEAKDRLVLFYVDLKQFKIMERNTLSYSDIYSVRFLCEKEVLILTRELEIHHYTIQSGKIRVKNKKISAAFPQIPKDQYIHHCQIVGNIDEEQDSIIAVFYVLKKKKKKNQQVEKSFQILKVKEYLRTFQGKIEVQQEDFLVLQNLHSSVLLDNFQVWWNDGYFCIETKHEILILKKKFKKYLFIDNVMEKIHDHNLRLNQGAIVSSYGKNAMEVSVIQFGDPKCFCKILDTIQIDADLIEGFRMLWPFKNEKQTCLMFVFQREKKLIFHNVVKMEPMKKMLDVVKKCDKDKISVIQEIAVNLGINKKDFYLTLWQSSKRQIPDIYQFLLPCGDVPSIKKQIRLTMRRKKIVVTDFLKILERIGQIIKNQLKTNLSQAMLKQYIKNDFLLRKIKLKDKNKRLDHRDLEKVYNSSLTDIFVEIIQNELFPEDKKEDPLHVMVDKPEKEVIQLSHVFQEFRIVILENYKQFISDLLGHFEGMYQPKPQNQQGKNLYQSQQSKSGQSQIKMVHQLIEVIDKYFYLLPYYPFEINMFMHEAQYKTEVELNKEMQKQNNIGQKQNLWFTHMTSVEFNRQMSKERIERELHQYYPTSKITDAINTLVNSPEGASGKLKKHGLISCTIQQYKYKLKQLYDIKLFLKVCEHANQINVYSDENLSPQLVEIFKAKNNLVNEPYERVKLFTSMHKFMLKNNFCQKRINGKLGFTTQELIQFTKQDLVALFFLENRQRKEYIFNQFRDLYQDLYHNAIQFNKVIQEFIKSQNCSRIELEIFIKQVQLKGVQFQADNQPLIELLIDGFCDKLQIREDTDTKHFIELMQEIQLSKDLGMKINKIMQVRKCLGILNVFNCEKLTYLKVLSYQKDNQIFKILLDRYFTQQLKREEVNIEDQKISLDFCRNMLTVLLYILETIYYDVTQESLLLTYGETLIIWKQFDVIKGILYDEDVLQKLNINKADYIDRLVRSSLAGIYTDKNIEFDPEVKQQIEDILDILQDTNNVLKNQEYAKLKLVEIFEKWGVVVHPYDIHSVCIQWNSTIGREEFITSLFDAYLDDLSLQAFQHIYTFLELAAEGHGQEGDIILNNTQYVKFVLMFAQRLLKHQRYSQIIQIFAFVKQMNGTTIQYELLTESFLQQICRLYSDPSQLQTGKQLIEYFTQYQFDDHLMQQLFQTQFQSGKFLESGEREELILVDSNYCFKKHKVEMPLDILWSIVQSQIQEREANKKSLRGDNVESFYCYYFLLMAFRFPANGLRKLDRISYNLQILTNLIFKLEIAIDSKNSLWAINSFYLFKSFIKGLVLIGVGRVNESNFSSDKQKNSQNQTRDLNFDKFKHQEENIQVIKNILKQDKARNKDLLDSIQRLQQHINSTRATKRNEKELRYEKSKMLEAQSKPKEPQPEPQPEIYVNNATMNLKTMRQMKYDYTQLSNLSVDYISENEVLEAIYKKVNEQNQQAKSKQRRQTGNTLNLFLTNITANHQKQGAQKETIDKILNQDFEALGSINKQEVINASRMIYEDGRRNFHEIVNILDSMKIGDRKKLDIGRLCKIYQGDIPTEDLKLIFPFQFFLDSEGQTQEEISNHAYLMITKNIQNILREKDNQYLRSMAIFLGSILESNIFIDQIYLDTLITIGEKYAFNQQTIIRVRIIIQVLNQNSPHMVKENLGRILFSCKDNTELRGIIKHQLQSLIKQHYGKEQDLLQRIRNS